MFQIYDPSLHVSLSCNDQEYLSALRLFESVCAPSIFPYVHQIRDNAVTQLQQKWFARCLQEILALKGDPNFFPVPINSWVKMAEESIEQEAHELYHSSHAQFAVPQYAASRYIA